MIWVVWIVLLLFFVFSCFRRGSCCYGGHDHRTHSNPHTKHQDIVIDQNTTSNEDIKIKPSHLQSIRVIKCFKCGTEFSSNLITCPVCGYKRVKCVVSQLDIQYGDEVFYCPYCGAPAHVKHIREWVKVKAVCPNCHHKLDEKLFEIFNY